MLKSERLDLLGLAQISDLLQIKLNLTSLQSPFGVSLLNHVNQSIACSTSEGEQFGLPRITYWDANFTCLLYILPGL